MTIKGVLFDFGNTLVSIELDWAVVMPENIAGLIKFLKDRGIKVDGKKFAQKFIENKSASHVKGQLDLFEYKSVDVLKETLMEFGINPFSRDILEQALESFFDPEERKYEVVSGAFEVLQQLKDEGYKLGLVSNASSGPLIHKAMKRRGFPAYFDTVVISAEVGFRKPHASIFQLAMKQLELKPEELVMIGDVPAYDVLGPKKLGMKTILVKYVDSTEGKKHTCELEPDAIAHNIQDIPKIINSWN